MIKELTLHAMEIGLNKALSLDPFIPDKLAPLLGKNIAIVVKPLNIEFYMFFNATGINITATKPENIAAEIISSPIGFIKLSWLPASKARSLFNDEVVINGDLALGQEVKKLFDELDIDWEGYLAQFTGDIVAHQIGNLWRRGRDFKNKISESFKTNVSEYIQYEANLLPPRSEIEDFYTDVDRLVDDVERIEIKYQQWLNSHDLS